MPELHPIFADCCSPEPTRYQTTEPFIEGGFRCATDGRIAVRQPEPDSKPSPNVPPVSSLGWKREEFDAAPVPVLEPSPLTTRQCEECKGKGYHQWGKKAEQREECDACDKGQIEIRTYVPLAGNIGISDKYARILRKHGALAYLPKQRRETQPVYFEIPGTEIRGLLMQFKDPTKIPTWNPSKYGRAATKKSTLPPPARSCG